MTTQYNYNLAEGGKYVNAFSLQFSIFYIILQDIVMNVSQWHFTLKQCKDMIYLQLTTKTKCSFGFANNTEYVLLVKGNGTNNLTSDQTKRHSSDYSTLWHAKPFCNK